MDEENKPIAEPEKPAEGKDIQTVYEGASVDTVATVQAFIQRSLVGQVQAKGNADVDCTLTGQVQAQGNAEVDRTLTGQVQAKGSADVDRSLVGAVVAGTSVTIQAAAAPVVVAGSSVNMTSAYNEVMVVGADAHVEKSFVGVLVSNEVHLGEGAWVLLNTPQAVAFGLAAGVAMALTFLAKQRRRR